jgi:hypothetical protein
MLIVASASSNQTWQSPISPGRVASDVDGQQELRVLVGTAGTAAHLIELWWVMLETQQTTYHDWQLFIYISVIQSIYIHL